MIEADEISSASLTPRPATIIPTPPISCPPSLYHSPSLTRSPLGNPDIAESPKSKTQKTPRLSLTPRFITPSGSPVRKAIRLTKLDPQDAWLPITESRNGNKYYAAFHTIGLHYSWRGSPPPKFTVKLVYGLTVLIVCMDLWSSLFWLYPGLGE